MKMQYKESEYYEIINNTHKIKRSERTFIKRMTNFAAKFITSSSFKR